MKIEVSSSTYRATANLNIERNYAPNDKVVYSTEFVLELKEVHPNDDVNAHALMSAYDWFKFVQTEVKSYSNEIRPTQFTLEVLKEDGTVELLFKWISTQAVSPNEAVQFAITGSYQTEKPKIPKELETPEPIVYV